MDFRISVSAFIEKRQVKEGCLDHQGEITVSDLNFLLLDLALLHAELLYHLALLQNEAAESLLKGSLGLHCHHSIRCQTKRLIS